MENDPGYDLNLFGTAEGGVGVVVVDRLYPSRAGYPARWTHQQLQDVLANPERPDPPPVWEELG